MSPQALSATPMWASCLAVRKTRLLTALECPEGYAVSCVDTAVAELSLATSYRSHTVALVIVASAPCRKRNKEAYLLAAAAAKSR